MTFAKLIDNEIQFAPRKLTIEMTFDGVTDLYAVYNPTDEQYAVQGWLPVRETEMPDDAPEGYHYEPTYTEDDGEIVQGWELVETDYSIYDAAEFLFGGDEP